MGKMFSHTPVAQVLSLRYQNPLSEFFCERGSGSRRGFTIKHAGQESKNKICNGAADPSRGDTRTTVRLS
jgi:hypothetical protein